MGPAPHSRTRPVVAVDVEPRLLRDALVRALDEDGVTIVDLREGGRCDILLTSEPQAGGQAELVVPVGAESSNQAGLLAVTDLLDLIHRWEAGHAV